MAHGEAVTSIAKKLLDESICVICWGVPISTFIYIYIIDLYYKYLIPAQRAAINR